MIYLESRKVKPGCSECKMRCHDKISSEHRQNIFKSYWSLSTNEEKWMFITKNSRKTKSVRCTTGAKESRRSSTFKYYFHVDDNELQVCKKFFLATLLVSDKVVINAHRKKNDYGTVQKDMRGKLGHRPRKEEDRVNIRQHIASIDRVPSHYTRKNTGREYIDGQLNLRKLYDLYTSVTSWCVERSLTPCKRSLYEDVFRVEYNIYFHSPKKDQCEFCTRYNNSTAEEKCKIEKKYSDHQRNKVRAREVKSAEKLRAQNDCHIVSAVYDLEQVLPCPFLEVSVMFYKRKLSVYNLTVYELGSSDGNCFMWHEALIHST